MTHDLYIYEGKAYLDAQHTELFSTRVSFGDDFTLTVHFPAGLVQAGQWLMVAVDRDMLFGEDGTSPMCKAVALLDNSESCTIALPTNSISFYEAVNGARIPVSCYLGVYAFDDVDESDSDAGYPQKQLALATMQALPVVATLRDTVVPLKPQDLYYTKSEVDASFVANAEKGVADGVATLDENGKVPREQIPEGGSIVIDDTLSTISQNPVQNRVITLAMQNKADLAGGKVPSSQLPADIINTIDTITVNGSPAPISNKTVALTIPQPTEQVQADWTESDTSKKSYILHKPDLTIYVEKEAGKGLSTNDFTNALKSKLDGIEAGAEVNAQADWTEADTSSDSYIKHKPALATVATSGSYNDLTDKPVIPQPTPQVQADWDESDSSDVSYIQNKPSLDFIPTSEKDVANGVAVLGATQKLAVTRLPYGTDYGLTSMYNLLAIYKATNGDIDTRSQSCRPIVPANLNYAVKAALTDSNHITLNSTQQQTAQDIFFLNGITQKITTIPATTTAHTFSVEGVYSHAPSSAPTYTLPTISDATRTHEVILYVTFSASALSVAFEDAGGTTITPAPEPDISAGKKYCFLCQYIFGAWQVMSIDLGGGE